MRRIVLIIAPLLLAWRINNPAGDIQPSGSGGGGTYPSNITANTINANSEVLTGPFTANSVTTNAVSGTSGTYTGAVSAASLTATGVVSGASATFTGNVSSPNLNAISLSAQDVGAYKAGLYFIDDMIGNHPGAGGYTNTGFFFYSLPTPGGVPTLPAGMTAAQVANHPGVYGIQTTAANDASYVMTGQSGFSTSYFAVGPSYVFNYEFMLPKYLPVTGDSYFFAIGPSICNSGIMNYGFFVSISDTTNGGNWVIYEAQGSTQTYYAMSNSNVAPVAGSWNSLQIIANGTTVSATMNGVSLGSGTGYAIVHNPSGAVGVTPGCMVMKRNSATNNGTLTALLDRVSMYTGTPPVR